MIDKNEVIEFFDRCAPYWNADMVRSDEIIDKILDNAGVKAGSRVLDVACGTGVLIPDYLKREVASVTGVDISPEMIKIAVETHKAENIHFICGDVEELDFGEAFDAIVIYNAFPHFPDAERLIARLSNALAPGGILTVAHGMSRERINMHHSGAAKHVSADLMPAEELAEIFKKHLTSTNIISNDTMYQVAGKESTTSAGEHTFGWCSPSLFA